MTAHYHEPWWLIESTYAPRTLYYAGHTKRRDGALAFRMTEDAAKAVRFPDEWAAKYAMAALLGIKTKGLSWPLEVLKFGYAAAEHIFDYTPRAAAHSSQAQGELSVSAGTARTDGPLPDGQGEAS